MKKSELIGLVKEVMKEANVTGGTATFSPGKGEQFATPNFLGKATKAKKILKNKDIKKYSQ